MGGRRSSAGGRPLLLLPDVSPPANAAKALRAGGGAGGFPDGAPPPRPRGVLRPDVPAAGTNCARQHASTGEPRRCSLPLVCNTSCYITAVD
jgi:hypothetical protein